MWCIHRLILPTSSSRNERRAAASGGRRPPVHGPPERGPPEGAETMKRAKPTDIRVHEATVTFEPVALRVPLRFGAETVTELSFARVRIEAETRGGRRAEGWGETPLNVGWAWPSALAHRVRAARLEGLCREIAEAWPQEVEYGHPMELGYRFVEQRLPELLRRSEVREAPGATPGAADHRQEAAERPTRGQTAARRPPGAANRLPWLASLICAAPFDLALHDAFGIANKVPVYQTYGSEYMNADLAAYFAGVPGAEYFAGRYPQHYLRAKPARRIPVWHLVGGADALGADELSGREPDDGYPVTLEDWLRLDGPMFLKIKLCGVDWDLDYDRLVAAGKVGLSFGSPGLSADFNCTVTDSAYVPRMLERLRRDAPRVYAALRYIEQPFAVDPAEHDPAAVEAIAAHKPVFIDESADDWRSVARGRQLGWSGVALKTCKTQTGALLALAWAKEAGMELVVQDLSNARLAQIPHVLLAAHAGIGVGVESNGMQYYPEASTAEARVHPGVYRRREGMLELGSVGGPGFGYRIDEIMRTQ